MNNNKDVKIKQLPNLAYKKTTPKLISIKQNYVKYVETADISANY